MGQEMGGRFKREGTCVYTWLIHADVWQKSQQYYKAIILQLKIKRTPACWISMCVFSHFSCVRLFATPWTVTHQAPLSTGFSRQE